MDVKVKDVTGKMYVILESVPLSWQRSLKSQRTVNSLSSTNVKMTQDRFRTVIIGWCHVMEHRFTTGAEQVDVIKRAHAE